MRAARKDLGMGEIAKFSNQLRSSISDPVAPEGSFYDQVVRLLDRIEYRRADSAAEREALFRLRYQAYMRDGTIAPNAEGMFSDPYDDRGNAYLFGLYLDGVLASSLRLHIGSAGNPDFPSREVFPDFLQPEIDAGKVIVDPTRFVVDDGLARLHRALPYATLRLCGMAAVYFGADHLLAAVRVEHQAFYRRVFRHQLVCEARAYPHLSKPICLMTIDYPTVAEDAYQRYPFFRTTASEQTILFDRSMPGAVRWQAIPLTTRQASGTDLDPPVEPAGTMTRTGS